MKKEIRKEIGKFFVDVARLLIGGVVLSSVLPVYDYPWRPGLQPADKIIRLNEMIRSYAVKNNIIYLEAESNYTIIYLKLSPKIIVSKTLKDFEEMFFIRPPCTNTF